MAEGLPPVIDAVSVWKKGAEPSGLGALFTAALGQLKTHLRRFASLAVIVVALELVFREAASTLFSRARAALGLSLFDPSAESVSLEGPGLYWLGSAMALFGLSVFISHWLGVLAARQSASLAAGQDSSVAQTWWAALPLLFRTAVALLIFYTLTLTLALLPLFFLVGGVLFLAPGLGTLALVAAFALGVVLFGVIAVTLGLRWALVSTVIALEEVSVRQAFRRSATLLGPAGVRLFRGPKLSLSVLLLLVWAVASSVQSTFLIPMIIFGIVQGIPPDQWPPPLLDMPLYLSGPIFFLQIGIHAVIMPIAGIVGAHFYIDTSVRYDDEDAASE